MNRMIKHNLFRLYLTEANAVIWVGGHLICLLMLSINQCFPVQLSHYIRSFSIYSHPDIRTITIKRLIIISVSVIRFQDTLCHPNIKGFRRDGNCKIKYSNGCKYESNYFHNHPLILEMLDLYLAK